MSIFSSGMSIQTDLARLKNDFTFQDMVVSGPTTCVTYMFGVAIAQIVYSLPALIVLYDTCPLLSRISIAGILEFVSVLLLMFLTLIAIGYTLSTFPSAKVHSFAFSRVVSTLFSTIPPVYYPHYLHSW